MSQDLLSVDQVARELGLHPRTVRNYVRDGRLKAVRIGKQYRIARADLEALTGRTASAGAHDDVGRVRHVDVSAIVQIDAIDPDSASRLTNVVIAAAKGRDPDDEPLRINTSYDEERGRLKIVISGGAETTATLLTMLSGLARRAP